MARTSPLTKVYSGLIAAIIIIGAGARFIDLAWHFSHIDDIGVATSVIGAQEAGQNPFFVVSRHWTYAPLQYLITPFLISAEQSYREILFWGRLPSFIFSIFAMVAFVLFYRCYGGRQISRAVLPLVVFAFSWENIIFAKQMSNYAVGLFGMVSLLMLLVKNIERQTLSWSFAAFNSFVLALLAGMQYSLIFFAPAFFLVLFIFDLRPLPGRWKIFLKYIFSGALYGVLVFPLWFFFLRKWADSGITDWGMGQEKQFYYELPASGSFWQQFGYTLRFYALNFYYIFQSQTAFLPEGSWFFKPAGFLLLTLFLAGMAGFFIRRPVLDTKKGAEKKYFLGLFFLAMILTWSILVFMNKLSLSPTRHALVFLPVMAVAIGEGMALFQHWLSRKEGRFRKMFWQSLPAGLTGLFLIMFLSGLPRFLAERRDVLIEREIAGVLTEYDVDIVLPIEWMLQIEHMPEVNRIFRPPTGGFKRFGILFRSRPRPYRRIAWLSHRMPLNRENFEQARGNINYYLSYANRLRAQRGLRPYSFLTDHYQQYRFLYINEIESDTELEYSPRTKNGANSLYLYVLER